MEVLDPFGGKATLNEVNMQMDCLGLRILGAHPIALHTLIGGKTSTAPGIRSPYAWTMNDTCKKEVFQFFFSNIGSLGIQSYCQMMSKGCTITETKRIVLGFHETILRR